MPPVENQSSQTPDDLAAALQAVTAVAPPSATATVIGESFDDQGAGIVRRAHAQAALDAPDNVVVFEYQDTRLRVVSKATTTPNGAFVLLVLTYESSGEKPLVPAAYRLYEEDHKVAELARDARASFQTFLERYAIPYRYEGREVRFLPVATFRFPSSGEFNVSEAFGLAPPPPTKVVLSTTFRIDGGTITCAWPFIVDLGRYTADVTRHRR
jgi:hypothetical protein